MKNFRYFLLLLVLIGRSFAADVVIHLHEGKLVMVDGKLEANEWSDASVVELPGLARFYAKTCGPYVFLALELTQSNDGAVDLYLSPGARDIYDLHASAKLGERQLEKGTWPDWSWWNNTDWVANVTRPDSFENRTFLPTKVREFQILRSRFPGNPWRVMFEVLTPAQPEWKKTVYPQAANPENTKGWLLLTFDR